MQKELGFSELDDKKNGYRMVQGSMGVTSTSMPGMWCASTTLCTDVRLAYRVTRSVPSIEESSRELHAVLSELSFLLGVFREEEYDENI
jgi:hypothetical protein